MTTSKYYVCPTCGTPHLAHGTGGAQRYCPEHRPEALSYRMWVDGVYISVDDPRHTPGRFRSWDDAFIARVTGEANPPAEPRTAPWRDSDVDAAVLMAQKRYRKVDEDYERVRCGYVYQARQRDIHQLSKVGFSGDPEERIKSANTWLEPHREFIVVKAWPVKDKARAERFVHDALRERKVAGKELFRGNYEMIRALIDEAIMRYDDV